GQKGAFARYDMDYWGNCVLQAVAWSAKTAQLSGVPVVVSGEPWQIIQLDSERFHQLSFEPASRNNHQLAIRPARGPAENVSALSRNPPAPLRLQMPYGAVLCIVEPGPAFAELAPHLKLPAAGLTPHQLIR